MSFALTLITTISLSGPAQAAAPSVEVRVRVQKEKSSVEISGFGLRVAPPGGFLSVGLPEMGISKARISRNKRGHWIVKWPATKESMKYDSPTLAVRGQMLRLGIEPVPYDLEIIANPKAGMDVVARLDLEAYIAGVLPSEMPAAWPLEALKAQAVAARSFVVKTAYERRNRYYDVDSTIMDQVYKFLHEAKNHPGWKEKITRAIDETRGQLLKDGRGRIVKAYYSADCGCQTEDPKFVWGKSEKHIQSVKDPTCGNRKTRQWELNLSKIEVREKLVAALELPAETSLRTVQVAGKTPSGRVAKVIATLDVSGKSKPFIMSSQEFRRVIGFEKLRSTDFKFKWMGDRLQILGSGMGHAVGLCQTGAKAMADAGMSYEEILNIYYPRVKLYRGKPSKPSTRRQSSVDRRFQEPA